MKSDKLFLVVALLLIAAGCGYAYLVSPTWLRVAVGPPGASDDVLMRVFADQLKLQKNGLRLKVVSVSDVAAASDALDKGTVQLAVVRPDIRLPVDGLTVAILRDAAATLLTPKSSGIGDIAELAGKTIGVVGGTEADAHLIASALHHLDLAPPTVHVVTLDRGSAISALKDGRIQAVAFVAAPAANQTLDFMRTVARAFDGEINVIPVESPDVISQRVPILSTATIPAGIWGGRPKQPPDDVKTAGVTYRLMARSDADRVIIATLTEALFQTRSRLAVKARSANFMHAPDMDSSASATSAGLPNHPGAVDYYQRETPQSVMDRYGDWIYLGAFFGSGIASAFAWLNQRLRQRGREKIDDVLDRLVSILDEARTATDLTRLDELTAEIDDLLREAVTHARQGTAGSRSMSALVLAIDGSRMAVDDRRRQISHETPDSQRRPDSAPRLVTIS